MTSIGDILEELNLSMAAEQLEVRQVIPDNPTEAQLDAIPVVGADARGRAGRAAGLPINEVTSALTLMELKGKVRQVGGMNYVVAREVGMA